MCIRDSYRGRSQQIFTKVFGKSSFQKPVCMARHRGSIMDKAARLLQLSSGPMFNTAQWSRRKTRCGGERPHVCFKKACFKKVVFAKRSDGRIVRCGFVRAGACRPDMRRG